jgi:hypothetical protein
MDQSVVRTNLKTNDVNSNNNRTYYHKKKKKKKKKESYQKIKNNNNGLRQKKNGTFSLSLSLPPLFAAAKSRSEKLNAKKKKKPTLPVAKTNSIIFRVKISGPHPHHYLLLLLLLVLRFEQVKEEKFVLSSLLDPTL